MTFIPSKYLVEEGKEAPEGTVEKKCRICGSTFAVPSGSELLVGDSDVCEGCKEVYEKQQAENALVDAKSDINAKTAEEVNKALGN